MATQIDYHRTITQVKGPPSLLRISGLCKHVFAMICIFEELTLFEKKTMMVNFESLLITFEARGIFEAIIKKMSRAYNQTTMTKLK